MGLKNTLFLISGVFFDKDKFHPFKEAAASKLFFGFSSSINPSIYRDTIDVVKKRPGVGYVCHGCPDIQEGERSVLVKQFRKRIIKIANVKFVRAAIEGQADLSAFKGKPDLGVITGVFLICLGSLLGWPAVAVCGVLAVKLQEPLIAVIGGPLIYAFSHVVFIVGMYFSGAKYALIFLRWLTRVTVEKMLVWAGHQEA